ncbi:uncharacterized protein LOC111022449 [Momordica charantia]|uniref:Uncharacterized protein LOC111022449 n=1 Tax=Momordica charantia TaxID=3673 RepID=A0A6J1DP11_MOMCH|nr:uncharacterized protein LOC111022449 [Momordica charantia]
MFDDMIEAMSEIPEFVPTTTEWNGTDPIDLSKICSNTDNPQLCTKSISTHLKPGTNQIDPVSALKTEIGESIIKVQNAMERARELRKDPSTSKLANVCLATCLDTYNLAIFDLKKVLESIEHHDAGTMESYLSAVLSNIGTCDDSFAEMGLVSPLDNLAIELNKFASNCLAISKMLL